MPKSIGGGGISKGFSMFNSGCGGGGRLVPDGLPHCTISLRSELTLS